MDRKKRSTRVAIFANSLFFAFLTIPHPEIRISSFYPLLV